ncbi:MAG TPA: hypothetical protein VFN30_14585 [Chitinophagaceae bacterium]|nr:hypothetical protein [Chitinophagaceae bacterium]
MVTYFFSFIILVHGLIHFIGFAQAFGYASSVHHTKDISRTTGGIWLLACILFMITVIGFFLGKYWWPVLATFAVVVSQVMIFLSWKDAKFGTVVNIIILFVAISAYT